jgi:gluconolactonase
MTSRRFFVLAIAFFSGTALAFGQAAPGGQAAGRGGGAPQPQPLTETTAPAIAGVIAAGTKITPIRDGFQGTEGPITLPDGSLVFTETNANRITKIDKDNTISAFLENTNGANSLAFDSQGRLIAVQTTPGSTRVGIIYPQAAVRTFTDNFEGKPYLRPNDLVVTRSGGVYFTDMGGGGGGAAAGATPPLPNSVYYVPPSGQVIRVVDNVERPNGIQLSRDERTLYLNNAGGEYLLAFDIQADGRLTNKRNLAKYEGVPPANAQGVVNSQADGLAIDGEGRIYAAMPNGVQVFSPEGKHLGTIPTSRRVQNLAFAGADKKTLYMVGSGAAFKTQMLATGFKDRVK